jgi:hypothetical protein
MDDENAISSEGDGESFDFVNADEDLTPFNLNENLSKPRDSISSRTKFEKLNAGKKGVTPTTGGKLGFHSKMDKMYGPEGGKIKKLLNKKTGEMLQK